MSDSTDLEQQIDRLYALSADEFTAARNELAKALRKQGDREGANQVKALRRPSVTAWAVNQLVHHRWDVFDALVSATDAIREAHQEGPKGLNAALADRKAAIKAAAQVAEVMLMGAGSRPGPTQMRRVTQTLDALSMDPGSTPGRLTEDLEPPGFAALAGLAFGGVPASRPTKKVTAGARSAAAKGAAEPSAKKVARPEAPESVVSDDQAKGDQSKKDQAKKDRAKKDLAERALAEEALAKKNLADARRKLKEAEMREAAAKKGLESVERECALADRARIAAQEAVKASNDVLEAAEQALAQARADLESAAEQANGAAEHHVAAQRALDAAEQVHSTVKAELDEARRRLEELLS